MTIGETIYIVVFQMFFNLRERKRNRRGNMKFFIDTAKVEDIKKASRILMAILQINNWSNH